MFALQKQEPPPAPVKPVVKKENQWFDVGIVKVTNMVVTHFYVPTDDSHGDVSVSMASFFFLSHGCTGASAAQLCALIGRMILASCQTTAR